MISNEGLTSHGTQKNLIGYCYDRELDTPHPSCSTNHVFINTAINSNSELARRYSSNGLNIGKADKGFSIVVTGYKHPKKLLKVPKKHDKPSVARMQTQWASGRHNTENSETITDKYAHFLFPNIPKLFDLSSAGINVNKASDSIGPEEKAQPYQTAHIQTQPETTHGVLGTTNHQENSGCSDNEFMCQVTEFSNEEGMMHFNRCIWKKLKCDMHQNCGFTYNNDEINCSLSGVGTEGDVIHGVPGPGHPIPWSISTMSLLIIIYLAIVLILVLVTMLLLRWHRALRTPLDVLTERYSTHFNCRKCLFCFWIILTEKNISTKIKFIISVDIHQQWDGAVMALQPLLVHLTDFKVMAMGNSLSHPLIWKLH